MYKYKIEVGKGLINVGVYGTVINTPECCNLYLNSYFKFDNQVLLYNFKGLDGLDITEPLDLQQGHGSAFFIPLHKELLDQEQLLALSLNAINETITTAHYLCKSFQNAFNVRCCEGLIPQRMENLEILNFIATKV